MFKTRLINAVFAVAIITGVVVMLWFILPRLSRLTSAPPKIASTPDVLLQAQKLSQLVTVRYVMEKVVILQDVQPLKEFFLPGSGENRVMILAHGIVQAGVDLSELKPGDIMTNENGRKISIKLPPARAPLSMSYLDDKLTKVLEYKTGLFRSFDKDLGQEARKQAVEDINRGAREEGIEKDANDRAREVLTTLFNQAGLEVEWRGP